MAGGGSHGSGRVEYAAYLQDRHSNFLGVAGGFPVSINMTQAINAALSTNPFENFDLSDPNTELSAMRDRLTIFNTAFANFDTSYLTETLTATFNEYDLELEQTVLPKFRAGMRTIGMCLSDSYAIGESLIWAQRDRDFAKTQATLKSEYAKLKANALEKALHYGVEIERMSIAAEHDFNSDQIDLLIRYAEWDMNAILKGGQLLGAISGSAFVPDKPSRAQSVLGGALSGAAAGATLGWEGAIAGGILGAAGGFMAG